MNLEREFLTIKQTCEAELSDIEFWPSYYSRRYYEFLSFYELLPKKQFGRVLEVGCGIGYYSAFLSHFCSEVVATDQETPEIVTHQDGRKRARKLIAHLGITNVTIEPANLENLPYPDGSFDLVFSSHVLGYIRDQKRALEEVRRVLKPGGLHVCVVPARGATMVRLLEFQIYCFRRAFYHLIGKRIRKSKDARKIEAVTQTQNTTASVPKTYPFPQTQGAQKHWIDEVRATSFKKWSTLLLHEGKFKILHGSATQVNPLLHLVSSFFPHFSARWYARTRKQELRWGKLRIFQAWALNSFFIAEKLCLREARAL